MFPLVSIVIPNYNHAPYLRKRIDSVLGQTYQNVEVILMDDNSQDHSLEIINSYKNHPKVSHVICNESNSGNLFRQWKKGISFAKGEFIWIAESDDFAAPTFLSETINKIKYNPKIGLVYSDSMIVFESGEEKHKISLSKNNKFNTKRWSENYHNEGKDEVYHYLSKSMTINNISAVVFRKSLLLKHMDKILKYKTIGDLIICFYILMEAQLVYISKPLNFYRIYPNSTSSVKIINGEAFLEQLTGCNLLINLFKKEQKYDLKKLYTNIIKAYTFRFNHYNYSKKILLKIICTPSKLNFKLFVSILRNKMIILLKSFLKFKQ